MAGANKKIANPEIMWEWFSKYKEWCKSNPYKIHDFVGKDGDSVHRLRERPLTQNGFDAFLAEHGIVADSIDNYRYNLNNRYTEFIDVMRRIDKVTKEDQLSGGMCGAYHATITARLLGLTEKTENTHQITEIKITKG
jgi:hypothetical protein